MVYTANYPHFEFSVRDNSAATVTASLPTALHKPIHFGFAEKGVPLVPSYGSLSDHMVQYGSGSFDQVGKFFTHQVPLMNIAGVTAQPFFFVRLVPDDAALATLVVEVAVTEVELTQYQKDILGNRVVDGTGNPIPVLAADGITPVKEPGVKLVWQVRQLGASENPKTLQPVTSTTGGVTTVTYPIVSVYATSPGAALNRLGIRMYADTSEVSAAIDASGSMTYYMSVVELGKTTSIATAMATIYGTVRSEFSLKAGAVDTTVNRDLSLTSVLNQAYGKLTGPMLNDTIVTSYPASALLVAQRIAAVSPEITDIPELINIMSDVDRHGKLYDHADVRFESILSPDVTLYMQGGSDGTMDQTTFENLVVEYMQGNVYPAIADEARYPFTHFYDSGFALANKFQLMNLYSLRRLCNANWTTLTWGIEPNTPEEDVSAGLAIVARLLMYPDSVQHGTPFLRGGVYTQAMRVNNPPLDDPWYPMVYDRYMKRCITDGKPSITMDPLGGNIANVSSQREMSWTPSTGDHKKMLWNAGLNYAEYKDQGVVFYPAYRTAYPIDNSLLVEELHSDRIIYVGHICRRHWATNVGKTTPIEQRYDKIAREIVQDCQLAIGPNTRIAVSFQKTKLDTELGYRTTMIISYQADLADRVWNAEVEVSRLTTAA